MLPSNERTNERTNDPVDWIPYPEGESWRMLCNRVALAIEDIATIEPHRALIVSHGNAISGMLYAWLGLPANSRIAFDIHTCSITWLRINEWGEKTIHKLNETGHLVNERLESLEVQH